MLLVNHFSASRKHKHTTNDMFPVGKQKQIYAGPSYEEKYTIGPICNFVHVLVINMFFRVLKSIGM